MQCKDNLLHNDFFCRLTTRLYAIFPGQNGQKGQNPCSWLVFPQFLLLDAIRLEASEIQTVGFKQGTLPAQIGHGTVSDDLTLVENNQPFAHRGGP